jgi:hypothetical protein
MEWTWDLFAMQGSVIWCAHECEHHGECKIWMKMNVGWMKEWWIKFVNEKETLDDNWMIENNKWMEIVVERCANNGWKLNQWKMKTKYGWIGNKWMGNQRQFGWMNANGR